LPIEVLEVPFIRDIIFNPLLVTYIVLLIGFISIPKRPVPRELPILIVSVIKLVVVLIIDITPELEFVT